MARIVDQDSVGLPATKFERVKNGLFKGEKQKREKI
jgi:hypothetical protein